MRVFTSALPSFAIDRSSPFGRVARVVGKAGHRETKISVTSPSKYDAATFSRGVGNGTDASFSGELLFRRKAVSHVTQFREDLGRADPAGTRERHQNTAVWQFSDGMLNSGRKFGYFRNETLEHCDESARDFAAGLKKSRSRVIRCSALHV